jgi:hypothetical protein
MAIEIRKYSESDFDDVCRLLGACYPDMPLKADKRYFDWKFVESPLGSSLDQYLLAFDGGKLIGQLAAIRDSLLVENSWLPCMWVMDLMVAPEHRTKMAGVRLLQAAMSANPLLFVTGVNPEAVSFYSALRWQRVSVMSTFYDINRPRPLLQLAVSSAGGPARLSKLLPLMKLVDGVLPTLQRGRLWVNGIRTRACYLETARQFNGEMEAFLTHTLPRLGAPFFRSTEYLRWRFDARPVGTHLTIVARNRGSGDLDGYIVVRFMERKSVARWAEIADIVVDPVDLETFTMLLTAARREGLHRRVDFIRVRLSGAGQLQQLRKLRWIECARPGVDDIFVYSSDTRLLDSLSKQHSLYITGICSDHADYGGDEWPDRFGHLADVEIGRP